MVEGLEEERGRRAGVERPLNEPRRSLLAASAVPAISGRKPAKGLVKSTAVTVLAAAVLAACSSGTGPHQSSAATGPSSTVKQTTKRSVPAVYDWERDAGLSLALGGGTTSTLSSVLAPGSGGRWLIAGTQLSPSGASTATIWTSRDAISWTKANLMAPRGTASTAAYAATDWGSRQVVVGSAGSGRNRRAAVWASSGPGQPFTPVADRVALDAPPAGASAPGTVGTGKSEKAPRSTGLVQAGPGQAGPGQTGAVMTSVTAGALGVFAAGTVNGKPAVWYSTDARHWHMVNNADNVINQSGGAVVNDILSTPAGIYAAGSYNDGPGLSAALWYSPDGIHWTTVHDSVTSPFNAGDEVITSLVKLGPLRVGVSGLGATVTKSSAGGSEGVQSGLLAVGGVRTGPAWQPAAWISPNGSSWSQASESFPLDAEPPESPGALAYGAAGTGEHMFAVGGSPAHQRLWQSNGGLAWSEVALPAQAAEDPGWHLGLVGVAQGTTVLADNIPGQPYVLVRRNGTWHQPSASGTFGLPLPTAVPTSLVNDDGALVMSVQVSTPARALGPATTSVAVLTSRDGKAWRVVDNSAFHDATVNQLLAVPGGLMAVGAAPLPPAQASEASGETGAFARLSANSGATWPTEPISPASLGGPGGAGGGEATADGGTTSNPLTGPFIASAAGRLGNSEYVVGEAGREAVGWYSPDGTAWQAPQPLDTSPQLGTERALGTCWAGSSAVVVGTATSTGPGSEPAAWASTDGSSWTSATFSGSTAAPAASSTTVNGCLSTGNGFIAYGGISGTGPALWDSRNGTTWKRLPATFSGFGGGPATGPEVAPLDGIALGTTTWLGLSGDGDLPSQVWPAPVGGAAGARLTPAGLWASNNAGNSWQQLGTSGPAFKATIYAQADEATYVGQDPVVAGTVDGRLAVWVGRPAVRGTTG